MPTGKNQNRGGNRGTGSSSQARMSANRSQPWSAPRQQPARAEQPQRSASGRPTAAAASGGESSGAGVSQRQQSSVRDMIQRLDKPLETPASSPTKKRRVSRALSPSSVASSAASASDAAQRPVTEDVLNRTMLKMVQLMKQEMSPEFEALRTELGRLHGRIQELEDHIESRDREIDDMQRRISTKDDRISDLECEVDRLQSDVRKNDLILSGSAIPAAPEDWWKEDVKDTTVKLLQSCNPTVDVAESDVVDAFRIGKRKSLLVKFKSSGKNSVKDKLYEQRFDLKPPSPSEGASADDHKLFIRENLSPYRQAIFQALVQEKQAKRIHTVFNSLGHHSKFVGSNSGIANLSVG